MEVLAILAMGFVCVACFLAGAKLGQTVTKGEDIKLPSLNPVQAVRDHKSRREAEVELDRFNTIMQNIEKYNGTPYGQEDVP